MAVLIPPITLSQDSSLSRTEALIQGLDAEGKSGSKSIPNGLPVEETGLPLLFKEAGDGPHHKVTLPRFAQLTSTNPANLYGLADRKGNLSPGLDADIVIWSPLDHKFSDTSARLSTTNSMLHHSCKYTPFEGFTVSAWCRKMLLRGWLVGDRYKGGIWAAGLRSVPQARKIKHCNRPDRNGPARHGAWRV